MMDFDDLPKSDIAKDMLSMVSPIYSRSYVGKWLFEAISYPFEIARKVIDDLKYEGIPETATWSLPMWEEEYGIETNTALSIEERRRAISQKRNYRRPMNPYRISQMVSEICGCEVYVRENVAPHTYEVCISRASAVAIDYASIVNVVRKVKQSQKHVRVVMDDGVRIRIRADPHRAAYPYRMSGTHPRINNVGCIAPSDVILLPEGSGKGIQYNPSGMTNAGTYPQKSTIGQISQMYIAASPTGESAHVPYVPAGTSAVGTYPDVSLGGASETPELGAEISGKASGIVYRPCGAPKL